MDLFGDALGELRAHYETVDWSATSLGPVEAWSPVLRSTVRLALSTRFAITLLWGPDYVLIYNSAYAEMIGDKHPYALGRPCREIFPEAWDVVGPMLDAVRVGEGATWVEDLPLPLIRNGALSEAYFTFSYSPVGDSDGRVEGIIDITAETTGVIVASRRLELLSRLERALADVGHVSEIAAAALPVLRDSGRDFDAVDVVSTPATANRTAGSRLIPLPGLADETSTWLSLHLDPLVVDDAATAEFIGLITATLSRAADRVAVQEAGVALSEALQRRLLPKTMPSSDGIQLAFGYRPAGRHSHIGGDWYDAFRLADGSTVLVVGDVMGHDREAAVVMGELRNVLRGVAGTTDGRPSTVLSALDKVVRDLSIDAIATTVVACIAPSCGALGRSVIWSSAGHLPPLVRRRDGSVESLETVPDLLLGVQADAVRHDHEVALNAGDGLLLYSDGLVERRDRTLDDGIAALASTWSTAEATLPDQLEGILDAHGDDWEDDVALVLARVDVTD